jgi:heat-inducible transcriptional repressor
MTSLAFPGRRSHQDPDLDHRLRDVFVALVALHGRTARPVGSEALAREAGIPLSPASLRHDLAELEGLGLLERSHASAGRVPTAGGYEFFIRALLTPAALPDPLLERIRNELQRSTRDVEALLREASRILSTLTEQLGLAVARSLDEERLERLDLEPLDEQRVVMVLDLASGGAHTLVLRLDTPLDRAELAEVAAVLRERLAGLRIAEVRERFGADPELIRRSAVRLVVRAAVDQWSDGVATRLITAGTSRIAQQPEFATAQQLGPVLRAVEGGASLERLMVSGVEGYAAVRVGLDSSSGLEACSLVSFTLPGQVRGAVGVLGPVRMNYAFALAVVDEVGSHVAELLQA